MSLLGETCARIQSIDPAIARQTQMLLDDKTKPRGSLGVLESLACRLAAISGCAEPALPVKAVVVMAADHGVTEEGVSAYPAEVTAQMVANFARGGAAINVLARQAGAQVLVVDMGTRGDGCHGVRDERIGPGTANMARGPAMSVQQALEAVDAGIQIAAELIDAGVGLIGVGEMGIGNTTAASALTSLFTGEPPLRVTGRGTGIDEATWKRKVAVIERALAVNQPTRDQPLDALAKVGGFELAGLVGVMLGAAARRVPVVLDGFITGAAALAAVGICPHVRDYLIDSHQSVEPGHRRLLDHLELRPLLNLDLRLGEGTGAVLAMHLVEAALRIVREMATFRSAGVTSTGA
jgi:nicotinate-nucleotide--dimethylbenzimidazole phosphoribosyltransferase